MDVVWIGLLYSENCIILF